MSLLKEWRFFTKISIAFDTFVLLLKKISLHIISFDAAILEKSRKPPALYFIKLYLCFFQNLAQILRDYKQLNAVNDLSLKKSYHVFQNSLQQF